MTRRPMSRLRQVALARFVLDLLAIRDRNPKMEWPSTAFESNVREEARRLRLLEARETPCEMCGNASKHQLCADCRSELEGAAGDLQ